VAEKLYFQSPARDLVSLLDRRPGGVALDVGTGSGVVAAALRDAIAPRVLVGCDRSPGMLRVARRRIRSGRFLAAMLPDIPFRDAAFGAITLGFVLSHVEDVNVALHEVRRLLEPGGQIALSAWAASPGSSAPGSVWMSVAHAFIPLGELQREMGRSLPAEEQLSSLDGVARALEDAGLEDRHVEQRCYRIVARTDDYIESRLVSMTSRYLFFHLPRREWERFVATARGTLEEQFGETMTFDSIVNLAVARRRG
jgi:SAM-dependent methyltransferase